MGLAERTIDFFLSAFRFPGLDWWLVLVAIGLGLAFGAVWLSLYRPPLHKRPWLFLAVAVLAAFLTWTAVAFVQIPLQTWTQQALLHFWSSATLTRWLLLAGAPLVLLSGLVQEGAKLVPVVFYWLGRHRHLSLRDGLFVGAIAGAGFGVFEAVWVHNSVFAAGWTWHSVETSGVLALIAFWERFFTVGFHIAVSALSGYGLARGWGWQFYLLASVLHGAANYAVVLLSKGLLSSNQTEIYIAVFAAVLTAVILWLRARYRPAGEAAA